jgi:predicted dehydrogenase
MENLSDAILGRGKPLLGRTDALGQARTIEALYRSAATGEPVALNV